MYLEILKLHFRILSIISQIPKLFCMCVKFTIHSYQCFVHFKIYMEHTCIYKVSHLLHSSSKWSPWLTWFRLYRMTFPWAPSMSLSRPYTPPCGPCALTNTNSISSKSCLVNFSLVEAIVELRCLYRTHSD